MGRFLQIRVSVSTADEESVAKTWPRLVRLAWADGLPPVGSRGALELTAALADRLALGMLPPQAAKAVGGSVRRAGQARQDLEEALARRQPAEADRITYALEDALDEAEQSAARL